MEQKNEIYKRVYKINHEVLPYEIELNLPHNVINNIYSFLRKNNSTRSVKIEMLSISINHKIIALREKLEQRKKIRLHNKLKKQQFLDILNDIENKLIKLLPNQTK